MARIVLVADDSPTIQKKAVGILKGEGFEVETVSNGVAAIKRLALIHPVVILADVSMPGRDGYEVCEFVKKSAQLSHVPVLLVASEMEPYDDARGAEVRADGIIKKPFEAHDLISIVVRFAEQCEAESPTIAAAAVEPPATPEFVVSSGESDYAPTVVQQVTPDIPAVSEEAAFAEPAREEAPGYYPEAQPAEAEAPYVAPQPEAEIPLEFAPAPEFVDTFPAPEAPSAPAAEIPSVVEEAPAPSLVEPPHLPPPDAAPAPSSAEGLEAGTPEPVFIEDQSAPTPAPPTYADRVSTVIFRAPLEIAEPVWKDETLPAPPAPEPIGATAVEPRLETAAPVAPPETPVEQPLEHSPISPSLAATSLDSFSLYDATAGQVHFASPPADVAPVEVAHSAPVEEAPATEVTLPVPAPEAEMTPPAPAPEAVPTEIAAPEPAPEAVPTEVAAQEPTPEAAPPEPSAEVAAPPPAFDWGLVYTVVHKVVMRMAPAALSMEAVEELARRIAEEIAAEITSESSPPQP
ncbi:MAG: response regulator [Terriglobia bacterium]